MGVPAKTYTFRLTAEYRVHGKRQELRAMSHVRCAHTIGAGAVARAHDKVTLDHFSVHRPTVLVEHLRIDVPRPEHPLPRRVVSVGPVGFGSLEQAFVVMPRPRLRGQPGRGETRTKKVKRRMR